MFFDPRFFIIVGPFMLLAFFASMRVKSTFKRYAKVGVISGMTGAQAAMAVAEAGGAEVTIERVDGFLSDHYDPRTKTLRLSAAVHDGRSISAIAVGAHEAGHALQDVHQYAWLRMRSNLVPLTMMGSRSWIWIFFAGMLLQQPGLAWIGVILFGLTVIFQLVTLPVEFDASRRAKEVLAHTGIVSNEEEAKGVSDVLGAAAMTYVAGALTAIATLFYYVTLLSGRD